MVRSVLHFNNAPMRVRMYNALTELLRAVPDLCVFAPPKTRNNLLNYINFSCSCLP